MGFLVKPTLQPTNTSWLEPGTVMVNSSFSYEWTSFPKTFNQNPNDFYPLYFLAAKKTSFGGYTVDSKYSLPSTARFKQNGKGIAVEVFGKVIYERITDYVEAKKVDSSIEGGFFKGAQLVFNWKIESQLPPTKIYPWKSSTTFYSGTSDDPPRPYYDAMNVNSQFGWQGYHNSEITNVTISIRKLTGNKSASGGWIGSVSTNPNEPNVSNPFDATEHVEVATITIPASQLKVPDQNTLNDTNRGYDPKLKAPLSLDYMNANYVGSLKGYSDESILLDTVENAAYYITDKPVVKKVTKSGMELTETSYLKVSQVQGKIKLNISWKSGHNRFESDSHYYLTLQPVNHPIERMKTQGVYNSTFDDFADNPKTNPQLTPCDGWYGIERIWPWHYKNTGGFTFEGKAFDGLFEARPYTLTSTDKNFGKEGDLPDVYQQKSWIGLPVAEKETFNFESRFAFIPRFRLPNSVTHGSWNGDSANCKWKKPKDIISKLRDGNIFWSTNDRDIISEEFHTYGLNIAGNSNGGSDNLNTSKDIVDTKAEYFAWFKTPSNISNSSFPGFPDALKQEHKPIVFENPNVDYIRTGNSFNGTFQAKIKASFYYTARTKTQTDGTIYQFPKYDGVTYGIDAWIPEDFGPAVGFAQDFFNYPATSATIKSTYFVEKNGKYYGKLKRPGDMPSVCGFRYRKIGDKNWITKNVLSGLEKRAADFIRVIPNMVDSSGNVFDKNVTNLTNQLNFELLITDASDKVLNISIYESWEYQIFVKRVDGNVYYAKPSILNESEATSFPLAVRDLSLPKMPSPLPSSKGFWWQVTDAWIFPTTAQGLPDNSRTLMNYITTRQIANPFTLNDSTGNPITNFWPTSHWPTYNSVYYFLNKTFSYDKNYQFRTIVENYFGGITVDNKRAPITFLPTYLRWHGRLFMRLPWGERLDYSKSLIMLPSKLKADGTPSAGSPKAINFYVTSNINAFSGTPTSFAGETPDAVVTSYPKKPIKTFTSKTNPQNPIEFSTTSEFFTSSLAHFDIHDIDWTIQGQAVWCANSQTTLGPAQVTTTQAIPWFDNNNQPVGGKGWHYKTHERKLVWFDAIAPNVDNNSQMVKTSIMINANFPMGGDVNNYFANKSYYRPTYLLNNFVARYIPYQTFNLSFKYETNSRFELSMYLGKQLPYRKSDAEWYLTDLKDLISKGLVTKVADLTKDLTLKNETNLEDTLGKVHSCDFVGLIGNQYLFFVATPLIKFHEADETKTDFNFGSPTFYPEPYPWDATDPTDPRYDTGNIGLAGTGPILAPDQNKLGRALGAEAKARGDMYFHTRDGVGYYLSPDAFGNEIFGGAGTYSIIQLWDFRFSGSYHDANNKIEDVNTGKMTPKNIKGATYSIRVGVVNNVVKGSPNTSIELFSKAGTGTFVSGLWENGVWNSGWRDDKTTREFNKVESFYTYDYNTKCRIRLGGSRNSVADFSVGDNVAISNIVAIDQNDSRKLLKNFYTIVDKSNDWIEVDLSYDFSLMRIEKDSKEHRILVTKNVWMNGVFFNGYFKGIWNDGLFSGYPLITKMDSSHWIDGIFNGGHFTAKKLRFGIASIKERTFDNFPRLSVVCTTEHKLYVDDVVSILYSTDTQEGTFGTTKIIEVVDNFTFTTSIAWEALLSDLSTKITGGNVLTIISDGLIQNFKFYSNNVSRTTSIESVDSQSIFQYNSWIDVNYSNQTAVNIGRPENYNESTSKRSYSENNLYGYPTHDVLSSQSLFRDSFSLLSREYRLGQKYKIFSDFVGQSSTFEDFFESTDTQDGIDSFKELGWEFTNKSGTFVPIIATTMSETNRWGNNTPREISYVEFYLPKNSSTVQIKVGDQLEVTGPQITLKDPPPGSALYNTGWALPVVKMATDRFTVTGVAPHAETIYILTDLRQYTFKADPPPPAQAVSLPSGEYKRWDVNYPNNFRGAPELNFEIRVPASSGLTFSRTNEPTTIDTNLKGKELRVETSGLGGVLNLIPTDGVSGRVNTEAMNTLSKRRYSMVEFELVQTSTTATFSIPNYHTDSVVGDVPPIHFNNLNIITRERLVAGAKKTETSDSVYLPIYKNVNHLETIGQKKQEFFFNKRNLIMNFLALGLNGMYKTDYFIDNLKLYETDMIPFFQYFRNPTANGLGGNINISVQIPNTTVIFGASPAQEGVDQIDSASVLDFYQKLVAPTVEIPKTVNWEGDYMLYRTQDVDYTQISGIYDTDKLSILRLFDKQAQDEQTVNNGNTDTFTEPKKGNATDNTLEPNFEEWTGGGSGGTSDPFGGDQRPGFTQNLSE